MNDLTLAELVRRHPLATTFLNERHIDYCCGGDRNLYKALETQGYERQPFLEELERYLEQQEGKFQPSIMEELYVMNTSELIHHLESTHHKNGRELLAAADEKLLKILSVHYNNHKNELVEVYRLFSDLRKELLVHFVQEEEEVFPLMLEAPTTLTLRKVEELENDHTAAGDIIKAIESASHDFTAPDDACPTYRAAYALMKQLVEDVFLHIYKENSILFPQYEKGVTV